MKVGALRRNLFGLVLVWVDVGHPVGVQLQKQPHKLNSF